jgi:hypothetical protein
MKGWAYEVDEDSDYNGGRRALDEIGDKRGR